MNLELTILMMMLNTDCMAPTPSTINREVSFNAHGTAFSCGKYDKYYCYVTDCWLVYCAVRQLLHLCGQGLKWWIVIRKYYGILGDTIFLTLKEIQG